MFMYYLQVTIGAATDAQMAMEYACKDKDNKYKLKSLTAVCVFFWEVGLTSTDKPIGADSC